MLALLDINGNWTTHVREDLVGSALVIFMPTEADWTQWTQNYDRSVADKKKHLEKIIGNSRELEHKIIVNKNNDPSTTTSAIPVSWPDTFSKSDQCK